MLLYTNKNLDTPLYLQIVNQLKDIIIKEELPDGFKMPSERSVAKILGVHRNTIKRAYHELRADGYLNSIERKGFSVTTDNTRLKSSSRKYGLRWSDIIRDEYINHRIEEHFSSLLNQNVKYSFSGDVVQTEEIGRDDISEILFEIAKSQEQNIYAISHKQGDYELRKSMVDFIKTKGINAKPSEVQVVSESFQAIEYISNMIIKEGDTVIIGETACPDTTRIFLSSGARIITVSMDENGIICEQLEALIIKHDPKLLFVDPDFQNPTGSVMSLGRRKQLLDLSYKYNIPIIEEDSSSELRYEGRSIPPLKALDQHESVIYIYSFYFTIPSGIRIAFIVANKRLVSDVSTVIQSRVVCADVISQRVIKEYLNRGLYSKNLAVIRENNHLKRDLMYEALKGARKLGVEMIKPEGGAYIWCKLPQNIDVQKLMLNANKKAISFMPGRMFFVKGSKGDGFIRLNYSFSDEKKITEGIELFNEALSESIIC